MFVWLSAFVVIVILFGFLIGGPILTAAFLAVERRLAWWRAALVGAATSATLYYAFERLLELPIDRGVLFS